MLNCKNTAVLIKWNSKVIISLYDMLHARTFRARRKSLRARSPHAHECARNFLRPEHNVTLTVLFMYRLRFHSRKSVTSFYTDFRNNFFSVTFGSRFGGKSIMKSRHNSRRTLRFHLLSDISSSYYFFC